MLRSILLALDGIADAAAAVETAAALAQRHGAAIELRLTLDRAAVTEPEAVGLGGSSRFAHREAVIAARLEKRIEAVGRFARKRLAAAGLEVEPQRLDGDVRELLPQLAVAHDLVVLSNALRQRADSDDLDLDFALPIDELVRATPRPFVLADRQPLAEGPVVVAFDGGRTAAQALHLAALLGLAERRNVHVVTVGTSIEAAEAAARHACALLTRHGATAVAHSYADGRDPAEIITERIGALGPALVVMGAFGERALREWLFGSTTERLLAHAEPPLFLHA